MPESPRIVELQRKFEDNPRRYFASLANEYRKAGDLQRAISICGIYLENQPGHIAGQVVLAQALHASGQVDQAAAVFRTVLTLDPENLIALKYLGGIAESKGDLALAHENFRKALTADPRDHDTSRRLKQVEKELKVAAAGTVDDWIPPRSDEYALPEEPGSGSKKAAEPVEASPQSFVEVENLPAPAVPSEVAEADFVGILLPSPEADHHQPSIAEPVVPESAEETLAVPDLLEEAGETPIPAFVQEDDEFQYRTAEFGLPHATPAGPESLAAASEIAAEADALLDDAEIPPPPPRSPEDDAFHFDNPMRTGEYSLSRNTDEWNGESAASASHAAAEESHEADSVEPAGPFITETVAELYLQQGFTGEALLVYRQLARSKPNDQRILDRIATLEQRLADEHAARQAAFDTAPAPETAPEPEPEIEWHPAIQRASEPEAAPAVIGEQDDWFAQPDVAPVRSRQSVKDFFAVLGRAKPEIRRKPERVRVSAADIRAAADVTAGFGVFGSEGRAPAPKPIAPPAKSDADPQVDVQRFRSWLDGLSDS
jgi:tetratricopeptide (TPR) repeat protein